MKVKHPSGTTASSMAESFQILHNHFTDVPDISVESCSQYLLNFPARPHLPIMVDEIITQLKATKNALAPGPDLLGQGILKSLVLHEDTACNIANIFNLSIHYALFPEHFKDLVMIILLKPNHPNYSVPKAYWPIVLINTFGKLFTRRPQSTLWPALYIA
jgi:hypothetical protein